MDNAAMSFVQILAEKKTEWVTIEEIQELNLHVSFQTVAKCLIGTD